MQFDPLRAFPYPVLRPDVDDYVDGEIQVTVEFSPSEDGQNVTADVEFTVSVPEIVALVKKGDAEFVSVFACRDTYFRHTARSTTPAFSVEFPHGGMRGEVEVSSFVFVSKRIDDYTCKWINAEFGEGPFSFDIGSIMASDRPQVVYIDRDVFRPLSSVFELVRDDAIIGFEWQLDTQEDRVQIRVGPELKQVIDVARNNKAHRAVLVNSIYFAAVMQCISVLRKDLADGSEPSTRWASVLLQKCHHENISISDHEEYLIAERLMKTPAQLLNAYVFSAGAE